MEIIHLNIASLLTDGESVKSPVWPLNYPEECNPFLLYQAKKPQDFCKK